MEDFVSYKIARKLKGKGFREKTFAYYPSSGILQWRRAYIYDTPITDVMKCSNKENTTIDAPTISQVLKWLRDEKKIHIELFLYDGRYAYLVKSITERHVADDLQEFHKCLSNYLDEYFNSYEKAAIAGIGYCLDNLI